MKKYFKNQSLRFILLLIAVLFLSGCETLKGAASGFQKDWESITKWDSEFQEVLW